jgi:eukaryotic translation initiation factor 2C
LKRHHIRAFEDRGGRVDNVQPGTIFDEGVTDARSFDWYSASHKGILGTFLPFVSSSFSHLIALSFAGTTKPTRYIVLVDDHVPQLGADELQTLTASLTHTYQRCNRAVSVPAPV